ncbi:GntR family transcriptional regulator [Paracoccus caeni]|uniref:GntR family transcriptional regulator n=1 Tax=Paracoccus caeni TaxID=657651 RepID=UPI002D7F9985|nr:GntR family transcriptional regulator [Paracoccus caeni]
MGERIPIEAQLCDIYNVSRTVVREAIAHLRSECLVESRQGWASSCPAKVA